MRKDRKETETKRLRDLYRERETRYRLGSKIATETERQTD